MLIQPQTKRTITINESKDPFRKGGICYQSDLTAGLIYLTRGDEYPILAQEDSIALGKLVHNHRRGRFESCTNPNWLLCSCRFAKIVRGNDMLIIGYLNQKTVMEEL